MKSLAAKSTTPAAKEMWSRAEHTGTGLWKRRSWHQCDALHPNAASWLSAASLRFAARTLPSR